MLEKNPHNQFRARLLAGELLVGTFVKTPSMMIAEVLAHTDLDVVCIDTEHSPFDRRDIDSSLFAYRAAGKPALVRVPSASPEHILNALDCGATGVIIPHVDSVEKARACAAAAKFGDRGRGYAGSTRAAGYGANSIRENLALNTTETTVVAQIEDLAALGCVEQIAAVEGIDCLFIGMMDLIVALGADTVTDERVVAIGQSICAAARAAECPLGIFVPSVDTVPFWRDQGVSLFLMGSDHSFIKQGANSLAKAVRGSFLSTE